MRAIDLKHLHQDLRSLQLDVQQRLAWAHRELEAEWKGLEGQLRQAVTVAFDDEATLLQMKQRLDEFRVRLA